MPDDVDRRIIRELKKAGIDFACSVPSSLLAGVLERLDASDLLHLPVTREEEGVGVCAGAYLGGRKPCLLMQNSGLGNCINALASLTHLYGVPLFLLIAHRGGPGEPVAAQVPMGEATSRVLEALQIPYERVAAPVDLSAIARLATWAFRDGMIAAVLLGREVWS
ncbi:MAG: sulfopyruvate decarboxylase subunit alpha [Thermoplasmata archaeon]